MQRVLFAFACTIAWSFNVSAQQQLEGAKYELIRETINFLATDRVVSKDTGFRITCDALDYECFTQQLAEAKPIDGIDRWYNTWRRMTVTNDSELTALCNQIFADILDRPGKGYRKQLAGYAAYFAGTQRLIKPHPIAATQPMGNADTVFLEDTETAPQVEQDESPKTENSMIAYLALIIGIIALAITIRPLLIKKNEQQMPDDTADYEGIQMRLDALAMRMKRLEDKLDDAQLADSLSNLTQIMESIESRVVDLEKRTDD